MQYLARYTHRVAISNDRLIEIDDDHVVFRFKDYAKGGTWGTRRLTAGEFIRRFLQHMLPRHFVRVRYFGMLGNRYRQENLERARTLLKAEPPKPIAPEGETRQKMLERLTGVDPNRCPRCGHWRLLRRNGIFLLESYTPGQLKRATGGGNSVDVMQSKETLSLELAGLKFKHLTELERDVTEGAYHTGIGEVVQAIAAKEI